MTSGDRTGAAVELPAPLPTNPLIVQSDRTLMLHTVRAKVDAAGRPERDEDGNPLTEEHPLFAEATAWHAELRPGDVLYTPPYWWHHVETTAEAAALSVLVPFDPRPEEQVHACHFR